MLFNFIQVYSILINDSSLNHFGTFDFYFITLLCHCVDVITKMNNFLTLIFIYLSIHDHHRDRLRVMTISRFLGLIKINKNQFKNLMNRKCKTEKLKNKLIQEASQLLYFFFINFMIIKLMLYIEMRLPPVRPLFGI